MSILNLIGILAGAINLYAAYDYLKEVIAGKARPARSTMIIWFVTTSIVFFTNLAEGAEESLWFAGSDFLLSVAFLFAAIKFGYGWVARRDYSGLLIAAIGVFIWQTTGNALIALLAAIFVDGVGVGLLMIKAYEAPHTEPVRPWFLYTISGLLAAISVGELDWTLQAFPLYVMISSPLVVVVIKLGERAAHKKAQTAK